MAHHFIDTPRTDVADRTRFDATIGDVSFGVAEPSFVRPDGRNDLLGAMRSKSGVTTLVTPRVPLASKRNVQQSKPEFTPLLHSATKNAMRVRGIEDKENKYGKLRTPAALKPGFQLSSPNIPEVSEFGSSDLHSFDNNGERTPAAVGIESSSIDISTPQALPKGDLGMDGGNMLTLKEQENKLEQIDKENFGLKLKIHYLEEALGKTGSEYQQQMTRDHVELQAGKIVMEREMKRYKKMLIDAERNLELYRQQLLEYTEKVKRRHEDEIASEELSKVQQLADAREEEIQRLRRQIEENESRGDNEEIEKLRDELGVLEAELESKEQALEQKEEELDEFHAKAKAAANDLDTELNERDRKIDAQAEELDQLREQVSKFEHADEITSEQLSRVQQLADARDEEIQKLRRQIEESESQGDDEEMEKLRDEVYVLEAELESKERALEQKEEELDALNAKTNAAAKDLETKLHERDRKIDEQANELNQLREQVAKLERERDERVDGLQAKLDAAAEEHATELDDLRKQLEMAQRDKQEQLRNFETRLQTYDREKRAELEATQRKLESLEKEKASETTAADIATLRKELAAKERQLTNLEETSRRHVSAQAKMQDTRMEVGRLQTLLAETEKRHAKEIHGLAKTLTFLKAKSDREERFRESLGWQKRWFLLMVNMYGRCNRMDLRLLEEIGITPDPEVRERARRPGLRTVVWALVFCERTRKAAEVWREKKKVQDALVRKVEAMRGRRVEGKRVMHVYR